MHLSTIYSLIPLLLPLTTAFIIGPTIKSNVTVPKCLDTTGTMFVPAINKHIDFTFNHVGKYACVLNDVNSKGTARNAPGDDPSPDFTVGADIETEVGHQNCLQVTGTIKIPGVGSAGVTFKAVDKYACMFSVVGEIDKTGAVNATGVEGGKAAAASPSASVGTLTTSFKAAATTQGAESGEHKDKDEHKDEHKDDDDEEDDSCDAD